ncbi:hypothetical protein MK139_07810, partial [bacterium]|nr:hypothetical protein [bacterium]
QQRPPGPSSGNTSIPELKQVIVAFGGQVIMRDTFEEALVELFGSGDRSLAGDADVAAVSDPSETRSAASIAVDAEKHYENVRKALQSWNWSQAGREMQSLERAIRDLRKELEK